ncbi:unnamed protein product [Spirodela intermedia]|uniref:Uncharacterized protein n=2 Tax=Spirodela intermedia TaxID=51605 RepID=A0A7I8JG49_SPIIN|nr:unnamed protein product [Spirodela intermedia]CAA6669138.1 unnamed protein product [Spirodela intermedia]CAA7406087.1 unnamed protein product [Spirodela intermedia]
MGDYYGYGSGSGDRRQPEHGASHTQIVPYLPPRPPSPDPPPPAKASGGAAVWGCFSGDPEMKRRRRVASYKAYAVEGKVKSSIRRGFRWIKHRCSEIIRGW